MKHKINLLKDLKISLVILSFIITNTSVMVFAFLDYWISAHFGRSVNYNPSDALGMIIPMGAVMGIISWILINISYKYVSTLLKGINRVSRGEFSTRLDVGKGGPLKEIYRNFNKMADELENTQTLREDFINHFSHEFKTPIMSINGFATLLMDQEISDEERRKYLGIISKESRRLTELSNNSLLLSRLESTQIQANLEAYQLDEQIRECVILLSPLWNGKNLDVSADLSPVILEADKGLMKHVWINLLSNAVKFTPSEGTISIELSVKGDVCIISIKDSGIGMEEDDLEKIFRKFQKGKNMYMSNGLGLGLSIVRKIVDLSQGTIHVDSSPGKGSCFSVTLPIKKIKK